jgi:hypothetical protein
MEALRGFIASDDHAVGDELPRKTFTASPGFEAHQTGNGPLTVAFEMGGVAARRMVVPNQIWMLQRLEAALAGADGDVLASWLACFDQGPELLKLETSLRGCRVRKQGGLLFSAE